MLKKVSPGQGWGLISSSALPLHPSIPSALGEEQAWMAQLPHLTCLPARRGPSHRENYGSVDSNWRLRSQRGGGRDPQSVSLNLVPHR